MAPDDSGHLPAFLRRPYEVKMPAHTQGPQDRCHYPEQMDPDELISRPHETISIRTTQIDPATPTYYARNQGQGLNGKAQTRSVSSNAVPPL